MDELLKQVITGFPNLAVALIVIFYLIRKIDELIKFLMDINQRLMDECLNNNCPENEPAPE